MWDDRYSNNDYAYGKEANDFLVNSVGFLPSGGRVLSLAEGEGRNAVFLAQAGFKVHAIDSSAVGIKKAKLLASEKKVDFRYDLEDLQHFNFVKSSGILLCLYLHIPLKNYN